MIQHSWQWIPAGFAVCGAAYYLLCLWSAFRFLVERRRSTQVTSRNFSPPVSILKPVHGIDPEAYESFRSHCRLEYPEYEIIFGVGDESDAAVPLVKQLISEFPQRKIRLAVCTEVLGMNRKVSNLIQMIAMAQHQHFVVNDGDIRVEPDYLWKVMAPLADSRIGLVTCLYRGIAAGTLGSRLEAMGISTDFAAGVLVAGQVEGGLRFGLGSTLAFGRQALNAIGGLLPMVDYLADDYELGLRTSAAGLQVFLADVEVKTFVPAYHFGDFLRHQMRWARGTRDSRRWGYAGLIFTFALPWALLTVLAASAAPWSLWLFAGVLALRIAMAVTVGVGLLGDRQVIRDLFLVPLRDLIAFGIWIASFAGHKVSWRGSYFILERGKLRPVQ